METTAYHRLLPLKSQCWRSCSFRLLLTVYQPKLPYPHWFHPTDQAYTAWPPKPFSNQHAKCCDPVPSFCSYYLPLQAIFEPTHQVLWSSTIIPQQNTCPSKTFSNLHAKCCELLPYFSSYYLPLQAIFELTHQALWANPVFFIKLPAPPSHFWTNTPSAVSQSHHSSSDYLPL